MAQTHDRYCFDTTHAGAQESLREALLQDGARLGSRPVVPSGTVPGGLFFSFSLSTFFKRRFTASICSLLLLSPFVSSLEMIQDSLQVLVTVSSCHQTPSITWRSRVHSSPQRSLSKKEEREREIVVCVLGLCRTFWSLLFSSKLNVL